MEGKTSIDMEYNASHGAHYIYMNGWTAVVTGEKYRMLGKH